MGIENGAGGGFDVKGKSSSSSSSSNSRVGRDLVGLGLKLQSTESLPLNMMMSHHHPPFSSSEYLDDDGVVRSTSSTSRSNIYSDDVPLPTAGGTAAAAAFVRTLQPFDISPSNFSNTSLKSTGGGGMAPTTWGFPFTSVQWKELERQAMIYKCMMAAVPVPPDLLLPTNLSADPSATHSPSSIFNSRLAGNKDPEPGRCKRTDGKKWRCSRDVAPNQKYCERHMHRGRPRSRKPVEVHAPQSNATTIAASNSKKGRLNHSHFLSTPNDFPNQTFSTNCSSPRLLGSTTHPNDQNNSALFKEPNRGLELGIEGGMVTMETSGSQWQHLMQTNMGFNSNNNACVFQQDYVLEPLNLLSYSDFSDREQQAIECNLFLNPDLVSLEKQSQMDTSRGFIDAWSNENTSTATTTKRKESSGNSHGYGNGNLSPSSLTLSMAMAVGGEERNKIQMNGGVKDSENPRGQMDASWPNAVPWVIPTPGGPLAEVLRPSAVIVGSSSDPPTSPSCTGNGDSISPQLTTVSSPSGVLHRTMLSLSDGSVCNSPTIAASTATPENVAFHWLT